MDIVKWLAQDPNKAKIEIDRELIRRGGLAEFYRLGWNTIEGSKPCVMGRHINVIAEHLEAVSKGQIRRLLINIPPRHSKSTLASVMWPVWDWITNPWRQFLFLSYSHSLSIRDNVKCRRIVESPWFQSMYSDKFILTSDQNTKIRFDNDRGGYRIASSVGGLATGEGGDILVFDDPHNVSDAESDTIRNGTIEWYSETMPSRLNNPQTGAKVMIMQRVHEKDLSGHVLSREEGWVHLCLPARYEPDHPFVFFGDWRTKPGEPLWPEFYGDKELSSLERDLGSYAAAGQLQQRPRPREGGMFKMHWFEKVQSVPAGCKKVRRWDFAGTPAGPNTDPDFTIGLCMSKSQDGIYYIENMIRMRDSPFNVESAVKNTASQDGKSCEIWIPQDPGQAGKAQVAYYVRQLAGYVVRSEAETGPKDVRAAPFAAQCEAGNVKLVEGGWNDTFLDELCSFPNAAHDDIVDAASGAFRALNIGNNTAMIDWIRGEHEKVEREKENRKLERERANGHVESFGVALLNGGQSDGVPAR